MTGPEYIQKAIKNHGFVLDEREIANKPFAEFDGLTQNEYNAMKLVTYNAYYSVPSFSNCPYCEESNSEMHLCKKSGLNLQDPDKFMKKVIKLFKDNLCSHTQKHLN